LHTAEVKMLIRGRDWLAHLRQGSTVPDRDGDSAKSCRSGD
jgi:hypothetical protein